MIALAGCLNFGGDDDTPEPENTTSTTNSTNETASGNETSDSDEEKELEVGKLARQAVGEETVPIVDGMKWLNSGYASARNEYEDKITAVIEQIDSVIQTIDDTGEVTSDNISTVETAFEQNLYGIGEELFSPVYDSHYNFENTYEFYAESFQQYIDANEVELLKSDLSELKTRLERQLSSTELNTLYPSERIFGQIYTDFISNPEDSDERIIELRSTYASGSDRLVLPSRETIGIENDDEGVTIEPQGYDSRPPFNAELDNSFIDYSSEFSQSSNRVSENYIRLTEYGGDSEFNLSDFPSNNIYIQEYDSVSAAEDAYESLISETSTEREVTRADVTWLQIYSSTNDRTVYTDVIQGDKYVICIGVSETIWSNRQSYDRDGGEGDNPWDFIYRDTWLIQTVDVDSNGDDEDDDDEDSIFG